MTDRKPDDLYDALRNRLADYGQEPPAQLWAGIKAQLPPPVAQPQLRRRRWSPVLLMGLLLAVVSSGAWQWWHTAGPGQAATRTGQVASNKIPSKNAAAGIPAPSRRPGAEAESETREPAAASAATAAAESAAAIAMSTPTSAPTGPAEVPAARTISKNKAVVPASSTVASSRTQRPAGAGANGLGAGGYAATSAKAATAASRAEDKTTGVEAGDFGSRNPATIAVARQESALAEAFGQRSSPAKALPVGTTPAVSADAGVVASSGTPSARIISAQYPRSSTDSPTAGSVAAIENAAGLAGHNNAERATAVTPLLLQTPALSTAGFPLPSLHASADTVPSMPTVVARRWATQVLAGPAQTYRTLSSASIAGPTTIRNVPTTAFSDFIGGRVIANQLAEKEKSSTGFGVQVQARRLLTGRWSVSAGLGYQEYATQTNYSGPVTYEFVAAPIGQAPGGNSLVTRNVSYSHRDTYRFATVPLRVSYALGQATKHLRYGLLAGTDVAMYLGGRTSATNNGPTAASNTSSENLYRPFSLSVTAGLDFHYRVGPRLELLAQPNATYFVTSLSKPVSGLTPRYLWGAGALVGLSYDLK